MSCHLTPFFSFARTSVRPLACTRASTFTPGFRLGCPGLALVVPVHLVSPSSQPHTLVLCRFLSSSFSFCVRAQMRISLPLSLKVLGRSTPGARACETLRVTHCLQRSYGHRWEGKADRLPAACECSSHSPIVEVLRLLQDEIFGVHGAFMFHPLYIPDLWFP